MNLPDIEAFIAVVETGSIVGGSARLNLTQPAVSRRVQNLEESLGVALLDRQSKPLKPTPAGRVAYEQGRQVLRSVEDLRAGVTPTAAIGGEFRLGVVPYLSEAALSEPLDQLRQHFPKLTARVMSGWSPHLIDRLQRNELDAVALYLADAAEPPPGLTGLTFGQLNAVVVGSPSLNLPNPASLRDLSAVPWIINEDGCGLRHVMRRRFEAARLPFQIAIEAQSVDLRLTLIARGLGIGVTTWPVLTAAPWGDRITAITTPDFQPNLEGWLLFRPPPGRLAAPIACFHAALTTAINTAPARI